MKIFLIIIILQYTINFSCSETLVDKIIAVVNDEAITFSEFDNIYKPFMMQTNEKIVKPEDEMNIKNKILERMIEQRLIAQEAKRKNIAINKGEFETAYENEKNNFGGEKQLEDYLISQGLTLEEFKQRIKDSLEGQKLINEMVRKNIEVSFSDVQNYYDKNIDKFKAPEEVKIRHISVKITDLLTEEKAREKIESILKQIKDGKDFSELAKIYSDDESTKSNGGDLGWWKKGELSKELDKVVFSLKEREISDIIKISNIFHLMKLDEKKEEKVYKLSDKVNINNIAMEIREIVKDKVYEEKFKEKFDDFVKKLKSKSVIEIKLNEAK